MMTNKTIDYETTEAMKSLRGPLSNRATSVEFNEWMARDIVDYIDGLRTRLDQEIEISNQRGNHIEFVLLPQMHDDAQRLNEAVSILEELTSHSAEYHQITEDYFSDTEYDRNGSLAESDAKLTVISLPRARSFLTSIKDREDIST